VGPSRGFFNGFLPRRNIVAVLRPGLVGQGERTRASLASSPRRRMLVLRR
jgi:hypothetical protein